MYYNMYIYNIECVHIRITLFDEPRAYTPRTHVHTPTGPSWHHKDTLQTELTHN